MSRRDLVVVGNGMVGHKFLELLLEDERREEWKVVTFCEEPRLAYDRVNLSSFFSGKTAADLSLAEPGLYEEAGVTVLLGDRAVSIDRQARGVASAQGPRDPRRRVCAAVDGDAGRRGRRPDPEGQDRGSRRLRAYGQEYLRDRRRRRSRDADPVRRRRRSGCRDGGLLRRHPRSRRAG